MRVHRKPPTLSSKESLILSLLAAGRPLYGLELVAASKGQLKRGTVYVTLGRMEDKGYVESELEDRRLSLAELRTVAYRDELSGEPRSAARHWRALHQRFAIPVTCVVFVWLGAALSATPIGRSRVRRVLAVALVLLGYYLASGIGAAKSATLSIGPVVGVWLPNAALAAVAAVLTIRSLRRRAREQFDAQAPGSSPQSPIPNPRPIPSP